MPISIQYFLFRAEKKILWTHYVVTYCTLYWVCVVVVLCSPFSLRYWHHLKVCVSFVCECQCVSILVSLCTSLAVGSAVWFLAGGSQLLAAQLKQWIPTRERESGRETDREGERKREKDRQRQTPQREETRVGRKIDSHRKRWRDKEMKNVYFLYTVLSVVVVSALYCICRWISDGQIHTLHPTPFLLMFHSQNVNLADWCWKSIWQHVSL